MIVLTPHTVYLFGKCCDRPAVLSADTAIVFTVVGPRDRGQGDLEVASNTAVALFFTFTG